MAIGILTLHLYIPGCSSLKEKRSRLKPLLVRLHREFNISVAEFDHNDTWQSTTIACAIVSNDANHARRMLQRVEKWIEKTWPDMTIHDARLELI